MNGKYSYHLTVEQQPVRARMCGFGDKDRRPITPPPCIRLVIRDNSGQEVDMSGFDGSSFVLMVDLWHEDRSRAVNLVRHSNSAPTMSISSSTVTSFPPQRDPPMYMSVVPTPYGQYGMQAPPPPTHIPHYAPPNMPNQYYPHAQPTPAAYFPTPVPGYPAGHPMAVPVPAPSANAQHTRNLIGMNAVNACRLNDIDGNPGFWFILQDLSVRTEGTFRLKISMCDIGTQQGRTADIGQKFDILANEFSDPFTVYSAKKFPGVIESTPLSKCFAQQGIKIPIRKDGPKNLSNQHEYDADD